MTMHLEGPWLSTTGRRRGKQRFRTAEAAAQSRKNQEEWQRLLVKHGVTPGVKQPLTATALPTDPGPYRRDTGPRIPSVDSGQGQASLPAQQRYTGTLIKGIATMHKSNAIPILDEEQAVDVAHMRR